MIENLLPPEMNDVSSDMKSSASLFNNQKKLSLTKTAKKKEETPKKTKKRSKTNSGKSSSEA